jgi:hypothetical protein
MKVAWHEVPGTRPRGIRPEGACRTYPEGIRTQPGVLTPGIYKKMVRPACPP